MDAKISALTAATALTGAELVPVVQSGTTKKATIEQVEGYKVYTALVTQLGTNPPTAIVLKNTTGVTFSFNYGSAGAYSIQADSGTPFTANKTFLILNLGTILNGNEPYDFIWDPTTSTTSVIDFYTHSKNGYDDNVLSNASFEIRIYN